MALLFGSNSTRVKYADYSYIYWSNPRVEAYCKKLTNSNKNSFNGVDLTLKILPLSYHMDYPFSFPMQQSGTGANQSAQFNIAGGGVTIDKIYYSIL
ncbi:hypothetical protein DFA_10786 [Cavenderia fasciculata]|uniref:Uncharacterized protein n=1 Tax=Cavenderia fasciculata TaxID=261658 RepID=F4QBE1_CACFS|nr:uncharacterized protein DFA_10786 [Cavenderia fasciculata]EGG14913.1 hypothetical protein DFA_10786 [Cavenderia fasciculata]|eukprot:XP_004351429.1 hypothetical protein DFA_10786 [Cavenderia fasciculata]